MGRGPRIGNPDPRYGWRVEIAFYIRKPMRNQRYQRVLVNVLRVGMKKMESKARERESV